MIGKLTLAAAFLAIVPLASADYAEAARGDGARNGDRTVSAKRAKTAKAAKRDRTKKASKTSKIKKSVRIAINTASRYLHPAHYRRHGHRIKCVAAGKRRGGYGRRIPGVRGVGFGRPRAACRRARRHCREILGYRQARGWNPYARCVVVRRVARDHHRY